MWVTNCIFDALSKMVMATKMQLRSVAYFDVAVVVLSGCHQLLYLDGCQTCVPVS